MTVDLTDVVKNFTQFDLTHSIYLLFICSREK